MSQLLLNYFEETSRPNNEFEEICSQSPFLEPQTWIKAIKNQSINQYDSGKRPNEDGGLQFHHFKQIQAKFDNIYEYIWKSSSSINLKISLLLKK